MTFAASIVPTFIGGVAMGGLADRLPRRQVMIACDLIRCLLVLIMAIPGMPVGLLVVLLFAVTLVGAPFTSARAAVYPDVLPGDRYVLGTAVTITTNQLAQVIGFAVGGTLVSFLGVGASLIIDAGTFALSALIVRFWTRWRPAARDRSQAERRPVADLLAGARLVVAHPALRAPMLFGWLAAFYNAPEGVAVPLARSLGGGSATVGLVLAAEAFGAMVGSIAFSRLVTPARRLRWMGPLAMAACGVLVLFAVPSPTPARPDDPDRIGSVRVLPARRGRGLRPRGAAGAPQPGVRPGPGRDKPRPGRGHGAGGRRSGTLSGRRRDRGVRGGRCRGGDGHCAGQRPGSGRARISLTDH